MFTIPTPPASHVSRNRMSRNFQKEAHTDSLRRLPEGTAEPLIGPTRQAAIPTVGAVQLPKVTRNFPLILVDIVTYTVFAPETKPTILV